MRFLESEIWNIVYFGNSVWDYAVAVLAFIIVFVLLKVIQHVATQRVATLVEKTETKVDNAVVEVVETIKPPFYWFLAFWGALQFLTLGGVFDKIIDTVLIIWLVYQVVIALQIFVEYFIKARFIKTDDRAGEVVSGILTALMKVVLWLLGGLFVLQNLGVNVTSLIAGLGIGGLALALAAQKILEDLFASLAIYFDEPFKPGDFVQIGKVKGTVKKVGIKTTRLESLSGEEITLPNKEITNSHVSNFKRMKERRGEITFGVTYDTGQMKLKKIPKMIKEIISAQEKVEFVRANFKEFGDSALIFGVVYKVQSKKFKTYARKREKILVAIKGEFEKEGIEMAFPTQTVHIVQDHES